MLVSFDGSSVDPHVELVAIADHAWRVSDDRIPDGDARRILGYLEERDGGVEIMWMQPVAGDCEFFSCLAEALAAATVRLEQPAAERAQSPG
jgi:hypothetical protein